MSDALNGTVVLITGAGRGLGRRLAVELARRGASVALNDISPLNVEQAAAEINAAGGRARAYVEDVAKKVAVQALINNVVDDLGRIDLLIHHARVEPRFPLLEIDEWDWHRALDVNLTGAFLMTQSVARVMKEQGGGRVLYLIALKERLDQAGWTASAASLSGLAGLTLQAAAELAPFHIRVNAVSQGLAIAPYPQGTTDVVFGLPPDPFKAALRLCSPEFAAVTGHIVDCDPSDDDDWMEKD